MSKRWRVLVTRDLPEVGLTMMRADCQLDVNSEDIKLEKNEIMERVQGKDALCCFGTDMIDRDIMVAEPKLRVIANYAVGTDNIDMDFATKRKILVTNTPGIVNAAVAEMAWCLILCMARNVLEADRFVRAGKFKGLGPNLFLGRELECKTLGLIGAGRIGAEVGRKAGAFHMRLLYYDAARNEQLEKECKAQKVDLEQLLAESDFITIHVPISRGTRHMIGLEQLGAMKKTAYLINTARGAVIDENALVDALKAKRIAGAALDVYENEPAINPEFFSLGNVILTPHIAGATREAREKQSIIMTENCLAALRGERPPNLVNTEVVK